MGRDQGKYLFAGFAVLFILGAGPAAHASVHEDPGKDMSLEGERFGGGRELLRQLPESAAQTETLSPKLDIRLKAHIRKKSAVHKPEQEPEKIRTVLSLTGNDEDVVRELQEKGLKILARRDNIVAVDIPWPAVEETVRGIDAIAFARLPLSFSPMETASEGILLSGADIFHSRGYLGAGVRVAVIDVGFKGLSAAQASGDIPRDVIVKDYTGRGLQTQYLHGTACAEIVHDMAPQAELYLLKIADEVDIYNALDFCMANGIDIISYSLGTFGSGPGNGTGPVDEAFAEAREQGILVVAAAGNEADGNHWQGNFYDSDSDGIHEFHTWSTENYYNAIGAVPYRDDDGNPQGNDVTVVMRWNNWPLATIDYDLYLFDFFTGELAGYSAAIQDGFQQPLEWIVIDLPDDEDYVHFYAVIVTRKEGEPAGTNVEISLGGTSRFVPYADFSTTHTPGSSISEPADSKSVLAVGAIDADRWASGPQELFSSQGPTNGWAGVSAYTKPDISGPDGTSGNTYGASSFYGTSAATPHVAGAAALVLSTSPALSPDALQAYLETSAVDMGVAGKDNLFGWGRLFIEPRRSSLPWLLPLLKKKVQP